MKEKNKTKQKQFKHLSINTMIEQCAPEEVTDHRHLPAAINRGLKFL